MASGAVPLRLSGATVGCVMPCPYLIKEIDNSLEFGNEEMVLKKSLSFSL